MSGGMRVADRPRGIRLENNPHTRKQAKHFIISWVGKLDIYNSISNNILTSLLQEQILFFLALPGVFR